VPVEFLGIAATNDGSETHPRSGGAFDADYTLRLAAAHAENGWDRVLTAYSSGSPDPAQAAAYIADHVEGLQLLVAHRPNLSIPTFAAKTFATLDQMSGGRVTVHVITGGNDHEQRREGDTLTKDERYGRTREYMPRRSRSARPRAARAAWTRPPPDVAPVAAARRSR
jgi:alkanesulfonate monooxygenase